MRAFKRWAVLSLAIGLAQLTSAVRADSIERAGDVLQFVVPAVGYGLTFYKGDEEGRTQFYKSAATNFVVTHALKRSIKATRPDGGSQSFPSGHTSAAFQGAAFIHARYGVEEAWPAYVAATFVGYSRVHANKHHTRDGLGGAIVGVASAFYFSPERFKQNQAVLMPYAEGRQFGFMYSVPLQ